MKKRLNRFIELLKLILQSEIFPNHLKKRKLPNTLQFPITTRCNSNCITCSIWKIKEKSDIPLEDLEKYIKDPVFKNLKLIGINGGEPSLHPNLIQIVEIISTLPKLKKINMISNGLLTSKLLQYCEQIKKICNQRKIKFSITISLDGVGNVNNYVRGIPTAYEKTLKSIDSILNEKERYCDIINIGCTVSQGNIFNLTEIDALSRIKNMPISYHLAVPNKRIGNFNDHSSFNILGNHEMMQEAKEFFYTKYYKENALLSKFYYFSTYYYLTKNGKTRLSSCNWLNKNITLDESGNIYLCATASNKIGDLNIDPLQTILRKKSTKNEANRIRKEHCNSCIHYIGSPNFRGLIIFIKELLRHKYLTFYKYRSI